MHAVKRLAWQRLQQQQRSQQKPADDKTDTDFDQQLEIAKIEIQTQFETLAARDKIFSSLFSLRLDQKPLGIGSFGMVLMAEAAVDITAGELARTRTAAAAAATPPLPVSCTLTKWRQSSEKMSNNVAADANNSIVLRRGDLVAVKFEFNVDRRRQRYQLAGEFCLLTELFNCYGPALEGFPEPFLFGSLDAGCGALSCFTEGGLVHRCHHYLVMELLGENLRTRFDLLPQTPSACNHDCGTAFPVPFTFDVARQLLTRLMLLHAEPICATHNDLKLDQLMLGRGAKSHIVYLVDYGLAAKYNQKIKSRWGNRRYASRFSHRGVNSPLTDLESAAYIVARFLRNIFPWDGMPGSDSESRRRGMARIKTKLWMFIEQMRRGRCLQQSSASSAEWPRRFFAERTNTAGQGGPQLLKYMSRLCEYTKSCLNLAENIDYNYLFNCFVLPGDDIDEVS